VGGARREWRRSLSSPQGDAEYAAITDAIVAPLLRAWAPQLVIVPLGIDSARGDYLGDFDVTPAGYCYILNAVLMHGARTVVVMEGGYNLLAISSSVSAVARTLLGDAPPSLAALCMLPAKVAEATVLDDEEAARGGDDDVDADRRHLVRGLSEARTWRAQAAGGGASPPPRNAYGPRPAAIAAIGRTLRALAPHWEWARAQLRVGEMESDASGSRAAASWNFMEVAAANAADDEMLVAAMSDLVVRAT
jgi:hypothetical protein